MKKFIFTIVMALMGLAAEAQIWMTPYVGATVNGLNANSVNVLENRIRTVISANNMISAYNSRFIMAANINLLQREFMPGPPARMWQYLSVTIAIGDGITGACFGSTTFEVKGLGETEQEAMLSAVRNIKNNKDIKDLVATARERILSYYEENAANIIAKAKSLESTQEYEAAMAELSAIPQECSRYQEAQSIISRIYQSSLDHDAGQLLLQAQAVWAADPNPGPSAEMAMAILSQIDASAKQYPQAQALIKKIETRVQSVTDKIYNDEVAYRNAKLKAETTLANARIKASRDVAVAWASNQPKVVYNIRGWW